MKGCLVALACFVGLLILLFAGCTGFMVYKGRQLKGAVDVAFADLQQSNQRFPFQAPADGRLPEQRFLTYLEVRKQAATPIEKFYSTGENLEKNGKSMGAFDAMRAAFGLIKGMFGAFQEVPALLTTALLKHDMSYDEYSWLCTTIHRTLVLAANGGNEEAADVVADLEQKHRDVVMDISSKKVSYHSMRLDLEQEKRGWLPENLALILGHVEPITTDVGKIMLDALTVELITPAIRKKDEPEATAEEPSQQGK